MLNGVNFFDDEGMKALSSAPFRETPELVDCKAIADARMHFIMHTPRLRNLTLWCCHDVTDVGVAELVHARKLVSIEDCSKISRLSRAGACWDLPKLSRLQPLPI